jgi:hypothetical protein
VTKEEMGVCRIEFDIFLLVGSVRNLSKPFVAFTGFEVERDTLSARFLSVFYLRYT